MGARAKWVVLVWSLGFLAAVDSSNLAKAEISARDDAERKINLSGRQRMLSQFMSKAACFASANLEVKHHKNAMSSAHWLFETTLEGLRHGDAIKGMLPETNATVIAKLTEVDKLWAKLGPAVVAAGDSGFKDAGALDAVYRLNVPTLKTMNEAVSLIEKTYGGNGAVDEETAAAINVSGRQRMLTQKASKEFCYIVMGKDADANRKHLKATLMLFNTSLNSLINGNRDLKIPEPPVGEIYDQLQLVHKLWQPLNVVFQKAADGVEPGKEEIRIILDGNEPVLKAMNKAVWLYEGVK